MKALILAGGFATRLRPLSCTRPKQLFPIINKPLLDWVVENLERNGVREIVVAVNYMADALRDYYEERHTKATITFSLENRPLGTAGPIKQAEPQLKGKEPFLVINGDILSDMNFKEMKMTHDKIPSLATIALRKVEDASRFGVVDLDDENYIRRFVEKILGTGIGTRLHVLGRGVVAQHDRLHRRQPLPDLVEDVDAAAAVIRELDIEDRHVRPRVHDAVDRRIEGTGFSHHFDILDFVDHLDDAFPHGGGILHHEDFHIGARHDVVVRGHGEQYAQ